MTRGDYPTEADLRRIRTWDYTDWPGLVRFVKSIWHMPDWGFQRHGRWLRLHTGGWSGNEEIIEALARNFLFWSLCWRLSRAGGHHTFELRKLKK